MPTTLITGGRGFVGRHVVRRMARAGDTVRVLTRDASASEPAEGEAETAEGDIRDAAAVEEAVAGVDRVLHLASDFRDASQTLEASRAVNVTGTRNVLEAAAAHDVGRVVHCSTIGVHGTLASVPADESAPLDPDPVPYEITKVEAEEEVRAFHQRTGLPVTVLRPSSVYGPGDLRLLKLFRLIAARRFVVIGSGEALIDWVFVEDVAEAFALAASRSQAVGEAFIVGGDAYLPVRELLSSIAAHLEVPPPRLRLPLAPVRLAAVVLEHVFKPFGVEPPLHRRRLSFFTNNRAFVIDKARSLLGYEPSTSLDEGLARTIEWYREQGLLESQKG